MSATTQEKPKPADATLDIQCVYIDAEVNHDNAIFQVGIAAGLLRRSYTLKNLGK